MTDMKDSWITDLREEDFDEKVLTASRSRPILMDFWASWCAPCRALTPILEKLTEEYQGAFQLIRVNVEEAPGISTRFGVQGIPHVVLVRDAEVVGAFTGALPEQEVRRFLSRHLPSEADQQFREVRALLEAGRREEARPLLERILKEAPEHPPTLLELARLEWDAGEMDLVQEYLDRMDPLSKEAELSQGLRARLEFKRRCEEAGGPEVAGQQGEEEDPDSQEVRYRRACCLAAEGRYSEALEILLGMVAQDRSFKEQAARKAMLEIFHIVGDRSDLAEEYRSRLARTIF